MTVFILISKHFAVSLIGSYKKTFKKKVGVPQKSKIMFAMFFLRC